MNVLTIFKAVLRTSVLSVCFLGCLHPVIASIPDEITDVSTYSPNLYAVQTKACNTLEDAEALLGEMQGVGIGPVRIVEENNFYKVQVGAFAYYPSASLAKQELGAKGYKGFVVKKQNDSLIDENVNAGLLPKFFSKVEALTGSPSEKDIVGLGVVPTRKNISDSWPTTSSEILKNTFESMANDDPQKGYCLFYYAAAMAEGAKKKSKVSDTKNAIQMLKLVCNGDVAAPAYYPEKAALKIAHYTHYYLGDRVTAHAMYREIYKFSRLENADRVKVAKETIAVSFELINSGSKGTVEDVRFNAKGLFRDTPEEYKVDRAIMALMFAETFMLDNNNLELALEKLRALQTTYRDIAVVYVQAIWNEGLVLHKLGRIEDSFQAFSRVAAIDPSEITGFGKMRPIQAAKLLSGENHRVGRHAAGDQWAAIEHQISTRIGYKIDRSTGKVLKIKTKEVE